MAFPKFLLANSLVGLTLCVVALLPAAAAAFKTEHISAELVAERSAVRPGEAIRVGLRLQHIPHWHTYWRNPGDSGLPTTLNWQLPAGATHSEIDWPAPLRLPIGPLVNYGYEGDLLLPLRVTAPANAAAGSTLTLTAQANWLVCKDVCIPESATLTLALPVVDAATTPGATAHAAQFAQAAARAPVPLQGWQAELQHAGRELLLTLTRSGAAAASTAATLPPINVFPYAEQVIDPARHETYRTPRGYAVKLALADNGKLPAALAGIVVADAGASPWSGGRPVAEFSAALREVAAIELPAGAVKLGALQAEPAADRAASSVAGGGASLGLLLALALAFAGGMVLNLMPCVFPVLSIKLLSLAQQSEGRSALRAHATFYSAGVLLTFLSLAGLLLAFRAAGSAVGWGFQLQEPGVVFALALLFFVLGLNLVGAFEFRTICPQRLLTLRTQHPGVDAFASGLLAVLAASPCTAPFMGAALGFAMTQPPAAALAVFATLGVGMALPYVALVLLPGWRARLPRPGPWMLRLKQALAFPLFATVVWLVWVLGLQAGLDGAAKALFALVVAAFAVWAIDALAAGRNRTVRRVGGAALLAGVLAVLAWSWPRAAAPDAPLASASSAGKAGTDIGFWQPYDDAALSQHVAAGQPVFVDFTAAWCVSCQVNKRLVLHSDDTMAAFRRANVALMRADWTHRDTRITEALARLGRNGVPVYVLVRPGREPLLLPEILTARAVRDALSTL